MSENHGVPQKNHGQRTHNILGVYGDVQMLNGVQEPAATGIALPKYKESAEWLGGLTVFLESESGEDSIFTLPPVSQWRLR